MVASFFMQEEKDTVEGLLKPKLRICCVFSMPPFFASFSNVTGTSAGVKTLTFKTPRARLLQLNCKHLCGGDYVLTLCAARQMYVEPLTCTHLFCSHTRRHPRGRFAGACTFRVALQGPDLFDIKKFSNKKIPFTVSRWI